VTQVTERQQLTINGTDFFIGEVFTPTLDNVAELAGHVVIAQQIGVDGEPYITPAHDKLTLDPSNPDKRKRWAMEKVPPRQTEPYVGRLALLADRTASGEAITNQTCFIVEPLPPIEGDVVRQPTAIFSYLPGTDYRHEFRTLEPVLPE
jgi:hypothetical protein